MRTFISYGSEYDSHVGTIPMADLPRAQQDELIRIIFSSDGDYQLYVMQHGVEHNQPDALWTLVVVVGLLLERKRLIKSFESRSEEDRNWIINFFAPTELWLRLEEAFPPFDIYFQKTAYDWTEIESFSENEAMDKLDLDDPKAGLLAYLRVPPTPDDEMLMRLPFQTFHDEWVAGKLSADVDRSMAVQSYRLSSSLWAYTLPFTFIIGLLAFIPIAIFWNFWAGAGILVLAVLARKLLTKKAVDWVRADALAIRERFRWYSARGIIWARRA